MKFTVNVMQPLTAELGRTFDTEHDANEHTAYLLDHGAKQVTIIAVTDNLDRFAFRHCFGVPCDEWTVVIDGEQFTSTTLDVLTEAGVGS